MPTDPKDNKGGDLAEIVDLIGKRPKGHVVKRKNDTRAKSAREEVSKTRLVNSSREIFTEKKLSNLKAKADAWAAKEKADIDSGAKKPPQSSLEQFMAERGAKDLGEKSPGLTRDKAAFKRGSATAFRSENVANKYGEQSPEHKRAYMPKEKPLKTALVREVEPGRSRNLEAKMVKKYKGTTSGAVRAELEYHKWQSAAETGEAQAFVGQMKPGVSGRTAAHTLQSREYNAPPANQSNSPCVALPYG